MTIEDWRDADPAVIGGLIAAEVRRWDEALGWDSRASWAVVDEGRRRGHVPGWILREPGGALRAWAYYILHDGELQIGGLAAARSTDLRLVLDRVLESPEADRASTMAGFVFPATSGVVSALARRRFSIRRSLYLSVPLRQVHAEAGPAVAGSRVRPFAERDLFAAARLMASAYHDVPGCECFAPRGRLDEWARYVRHVLDTPGCGAWMPGASFVVDDPQSSALSALVLVTRLSAATAHVAQLVVGTAHRGTGTGHRLLAHAARAAAAAGAVDLTLMVDEGNGPARRLYARHGFAERSAFLHARRKGRIRTIPSPIPAD